MISKNMMDVLSCVCDYSSLDKAPVIQPVLVFKCFIKCSSAVYFFVREFLLEYFLEVRFRDFKFSLKSILPIYGFKELVLLDFIGIAFA